MNIVFEGYISGEAEKRFIAKRRNFILLAFCPAFVAVSPLWFAFFHRSDPSEILLVQIVLFVSFVVLIHVVGKNKKINKKEKPNKIFTDGQYITSISESNVDTKSVEWVKEVIDHGEFYELSFPLGKMSHTFICQKDLLKQGNLKEFEALFKDKLIKL